MTMTIPAHELTYRYARSGGPGGQHVNKTETKVQVRWRIRFSSAFTDEQMDVICERLASRINRDGELYLEEESERSQLANKRKATDRLRQLVAAALRPRTARKQTRPSKASDRRRLDQKARQGEKKKSRRAGGSDWD